jgi:large subunit ribosomal protein L31
MKENAHPKYYKTKATCACGASFDVGSTKENIRVDICSACHPLFTGKEKMLDTEGRVDRFKKKFAGNKAMPTSKKTKAPAKKKPVAKKKAK